MQKLILKMLSLICVGVMLLSTAGLVACVEPAPPADTTKAPDELTTPDTTTADNAVDNTPTAANWLIGDLNEKLEALLNYYGRPMSVVFGGDTKNHPAASKKAIESAIALGADAISIYVKLTSDGVPVVLPAKNLYDGTNFKELKGQDGLPTSQGVKLWSYEQLQKLVLKNADGTDSEERIATLAEIAEAVDGKCFIYIKNASDFSENGYEDIYNAAKESGNYSSFLLSPGANAIAEWAKTHKDDAKLADEMTTVNRFYHQTGYFNERTAFDPTKYGSDRDWVKTSDDAEGWSKAYAAGYSLLITSEPQAFGAWVSENYASALECTPEQFDRVEYSIKKEELTARYLFISDIHYAPVEQWGYINRVTYRGYSNDERMEHMCANIEAEYNERGLDAIFILGDLTIDDPPFRGDEHNYLDDLYEKYLDPLSEKLGIPIIATGGNHDGYDNAYWKQITGNDRQCVWENEKTGDVVLILDTFDPTTGENAYGSGISHSGIDEDWLKTQLDKYKDRKNVFICSHYLANRTDLKSLATLAEEYPNITAMFDAHSHSYTADTVDLKYSSNSVTVDSGKKIINTGSYSYGDTAYVYIDGAQYYDFNYHDADDVWGYQIVETTNTSALSYRIDVEAYYCASNYSTPGNDGGTFTDVFDYQPYKKYKEIIFYQ